MILPEALLYVEIFLCLSEDTIQQLGFLV